MEKLTQVTIGSTFDSPFGQTNTIGDLITLLISVSVIIAGILILILFLVAGWNILIGAGQNNPEAAAKGRQAATAAAIGFVVIFMSYWIIRLIETVLGTTLISFPLFF